MRIDRLIEKLQEWEDDRIVYVKSPLDGGSIKTPLTDIHEDENGNVVITGKMGVLKAKAK